MRGKCESGIFLWKSQWVWGSDAVISLGLVFHSVCLVWF